MGVFGYRTWSGWINKRDIGPKKIAEAFWRRVRLSGEKFMFSEAH